MSRSEQTSTPFTRTAGLVLGALLAAALASLAFAVSPAQAGKGWVLKETFGSANEPSFGFDRRIAIDGSGDLYVIDDSNDTLSRWNPDGTPAPFVALGTNVIDGKRTGAVNECPTVKADCDETTGNAGVAGFFRDQVAIDGSADPDTEGNIYVTSRNRDVVDIFSADGNFLGQFSATTKAGPIDDPQGVGVDGDGNVFVSEDEGGEAMDWIHWFEPASSLPVYVDSFEDAQPQNLALGGGPTDGSLFVTDSNAGIEKRNSLTGAIVYRFATELGSGPLLSADPITGHVFGAGGPAFAEYDVSGPSSSEAEVVSSIANVGAGIDGIAIAEGAETLYIARDDGEKISVYEAVPTPETTIEAPSEILGARATAVGTVDPEELEVTGCTFEYGKTISYGQEVACEEYEESGEWKPINSLAELGNGSDPIPVRAELTGLLANGATYHHRLRAEATVGFDLSPDEEFETATTYTTDPATEVGQTAATLNATVSLEGLELSSCEFEYGASPAFGSTIFSRQTAPCEPPAGSIPNDDADHAVSASLEGLEPSTFYRYRLVVENAAGQPLTEQRTFFTDGAPTIEEEAVDVGRTTATLQAEINPAGAATEYHFEWGTDTSYGTRIPPVGELSLEAGSEPVTVSTDLEGLDEESVYHFRVVATNAFDETEGSDQPFSTLNVDDLAWARRYELVSPVDKGPTGEVQERAGAARQTSPDGGAIVYEIESGLPDTTAASGVYYRAERRASGWLNVQHTLSWVGGGPTPKAGDYDTRDATNWVSRDLMCAIHQGSLPLFEDPAAQPVVDAGGDNLYRRDSDGSVELISNLVPANLDELKLGVNANYTVLGAAEDCSRVIFSTQFKYIEIPFTDTTTPALVGLYEWRDGKLANPISIPGSVAPPKGAEPGAPRLGTNRADEHALSADGSRLYFSAFSASGPDNGKVAVFLSEEGEETVDVSQSQTGVANDDDSRYQMATLDGKHVFFLARYGIAPNSSSAGASACVAEVVSAGELGLGSNDGNDLGIGCDLYRYSAETGELTDLSANSDAENPQGASVAGVLDASADGSRVYFAAKGQLVEGEGQTFAQNTTAATRGYNVYLWEEGEPLAYVATVNQSDVTFAGGDATRHLLVSIAANSNLWSSETTPSGSHLVFQTAANLTGQAGGGQLEAYRYAADSGELECVSCRRDGEPALAGPKPLVVRDRATSSISEDGSTVFFRKADPLAPGAVPGEQNLYEWREGQVSLIVANPPEDSEAPAFVGSSVDGTTLFFHTQQALVPWEIDARGDLYAARVEGGFPAPPEPPEPCDPLAGGACEDGSSQAAGSSGPATSAFAGPGNIDDSSARNPCARRARRAQRLVRQAKVLRRRARRARRAGNQPAARRNAKRARRTARAAQRNSRAAKRCRRRARAKEANTNGRAGK